MLCTPRLGLTVVTHAVRTHRSESKLAWAWPRGWAVGMMAAYVSLRRVSELEGQTERHGSVSISRVRGEGARGSGSETRAVGPEVDVSSVRAEAGWRWVSWRGKGQDGREDSGLRGFVRTLQWFKLHVGNNDDGI